jgi:FtsP/CotA-like multicopper oxidase with cupredoxin domain
MQTRRKFIKIGAAGGAGFYLVSKYGARPRVFAEAIPGGTLDPVGVPKFVTSLPIPGAMPISKQLPGNIDFYDIALRQFDQQILPSGMPKTTVWSYGSVDAPETFHAPAFTIEAKHRRRVRVRWNNQLVDAVGRYRPHILPVDQTIHWANPPGGLQGRDGEGFSQKAYRGPVPMVPHVHGAHVTPESDGFPEAWFLPEARNIPAGYAKVGSWYTRYKIAAALRHGVIWQPGTATFQYSNDQRATALWYHDHSVGMTRQNVYAGPAGFYLLRGGPHDLPENVLPGPAPQPGDPAGTRYYEIPLAFQDRAFNNDGSLFYPDNRAFFEGLKKDKLLIPFMGGDEPACDGEMSDIAPIWNPEFFGNAMMVNGATWPYLKVEQRRYRFRMLNGCGSRFLILKLSNGQPFWQVGNDGGFLPDPVRLTELLIAPAERADVIIDFTNVPRGTEIVLQNIAPDEPFGGGVPGTDFDPSDPDTTGKVMQFRVVKATGVDQSFKPRNLSLPAATPLGAAAFTRKLSLNELMSASVKVKVDPDTEEYVLNDNGEVVLDCDSQFSTEFGPAAARLGTLDELGLGVPLPWGAALTEKIKPGETEIWELHNFTADAHPIHVHQVMFEVIEREDAQGNVRPPEAWESGPKDTVISYPGEITRIKLRFDIEGQYVWHCHILEHEDNEMMRPIQVGKLPTGF